MFNETEEFQGNALSQLLRVKYLVMIDRRIRDSYYEINRSFRNVYVRIEFWIRRPNHRENTWPLTKMVALEFLDICEVYTSSKIRVSLRHYKLSLVKDAILS